jgi:hypothetical protein
VQAEVESVRTLRFDDGSPVRAASAVTPFGDGWLVAQDDSTFAAWSRQGSTTPLRLLPPVEGLDVFSERDGTKRLKPDLEGALEVPVDGATAVLLLGSGSSPARMRAVLVRRGEPPAVVAADLSPLYALVAAALGIDQGMLNLEGACRVGDALRWFNRGNLSAGLRSASVDVDLATLTAAVLGQGDTGAVHVGRVQEYELGEVEGVGLAVTDAVALPDGRTLISAAAEDTPNAVDDGPVLASAVALLEGDDLLSIAVLPEVDGEVAKVEGLAVLETGPDGADLLAVVDDDDTEVASLALTLEVRWA